MDKINKIIAAIASISPSECKLYPTLIMNQNAAKEVANKLVDQLATIISVLLQLNLAVRFTFNHHSLPISLFRRNISIRLFSTKIYQMVVFSQIHLKIFIKQIPPTYKPDGVIVNHINGTSKLCNKTYY